MHDQQHKAQGPTAWLVFPVVMTAGLLATDRSLAAGWSMVIVLAAVQLGAALAIAILERVVPLHAEWNRARGDIATDFGHAMVSGNLLPELSKPALLTAGAALAAWIASTTNITGPWPQHWNTWAQLALALVVGEFGQYWVHRAEHEREFLWRFHSVHHSAGRLYWLNAGRFHPVDFMLLFVAWYLPLVALGAGEQVIVLFAVFTAIHGMFQHANVRLRLGPLNWIFSMAELHRWHHSTRVEEANSNYGANLIVWDVLFGTRFLPTAREPPSRIGIEAMPGFPPGYLAQLLVPLRWRQVVAESAGATAPPPDPDTGPGAREDNR